MEYKDVTNNNKRVKRRLRAKIPFVHLHEANKHSVSKGDKKTEEKNRCIVQQRI